MKNARSTGEGIEESYASHGCETASVIADEGAARVTIAHRN